MKKIGFKRSFLIMGMIAGYMIGVGFASGAEALQVFAAWPNAWGGTVAAIICGTMGIVCFHIYAVAGRESDKPVRGFGEMLEFYGGNKVIGRIMDIFPLASYYAMYIVMVAGFAALLNQTWGINTYIGNAVITILSIILAIAGLKKFTDILGAIGPFTVAIVLGTGIVALSKLYPQIPTNVELIRSGEIDALTIGSNPVMSGALLGGFTLLLGVAFMSALGNEYRQYRYSSLLWVNVIGMGLVYVGCAVMGITHLANLTESLKYEIPNVALLDSIGLPWMATVLSIFIILEVISSTIPSLWSVGKTFFPEKTRNFNILIVVLAIISYVIVCFVPYSGLMNFTFTYAGYAGLVVGAVILIFYIRYVIKNKRLVATEGKQLEARSDDFLNEEPAKEA